MSIYLSRKQNQQRKKGNIFLIYAHEDIKSAKSISSQLRELGFSPWLDVEQISPGQIWQKAVIRGIEESAIALVLVSEHLSKTGFVQQELKIALEALQEREREIGPVIPVRLDESPVPENLAHIHWVNLREPDGFDFLVSGLKQAVA